MATTRKVIRQDVLKNIYSPLIIASVTNRVTASPDFRDSVHTTNIPKETFVGAYIYFLNTIAAGIVEGEVTRIIDVQEDDTGSSPHWKFIVSPETYIAHFNTAQYELHYVFHPEDINDVINDIQRFGTRSTLSDMTSDSDTTVLERGVLVDGATAILKRRLAVGKGAFEAAHLNEEAQYHEDKYLSGLIQQGYEPMRQVRNINVSN